MFIGDNGQGDVKAGEVMRRKYGEHVEAVFIHLVQPIKDTFEWSPEHEAEWHRLGIQFFHSYAEAALLV